ncbi:MULTISPECIES: BolA family transcriptional regulator [Snodgrassella]|uniref:BolA family protein n=1 Tax=Snodgrassella TaxID=1193515 RepID=UPI000C1F5396|nr:MULTISPECIES: BolA family protein [Snodgrassella]MCX8749880.1 BolA family transcriptional regulator [Snodgrassella sp. B3088]MCX8753457.1 BolA family transcriptional regulator [Snodgrassella sp. B3837]PIT36494.1 BolA family transcriptional regulator [Snodgrassella alvi]
MTDIQTAIRMRLQSLNPVQLELIDDSHLHAGHKGHHGGGHYRLLVVSDAFNGLSRLARQRKVHQLLKDLFKANTIHALSIMACTNSEYLTKQ